MKFASVQRFSLGTTPSVQRPKPQRVSCVGTAQSPTAVKMNQLEALKKYSKIVADTGEFELIKEFKPTDSTTNPSLVYKAVQERRRNMLTGELLPAQDPKYAHFLREALAADKGCKISDREFAGVADILAVNLGTEILKIVPGRVSTEVDAHLSYDTQALIDKALSLVELYAARDVTPDRLYIKLASTWEGIRACEALEKQGIQCNLTLLFSFAQAAACADAGASLISPFVGRIMDWYKAKEGREFAPAEDPGVKSVTKIYSYYKEFSYPTIVMAASFRNRGEIVELAGCDNITISPKLLGELAASQEPLERKLYPGMASSGEPKVDMTADQYARFEEMHGADQMAVDKLKEGIQSFSADQLKLEEMIAALKENPEYPA